MVPLEEDRGSERADQRGSIGCFRARRDGSLRDFDDGDGGHGLLVASTMSLYTVLGILYLSSRDCRPRQPGISFSFSSPSRTRLTA